MKIKGKQLEDTLRTENNKFTAVYSDDFVGNLNGGVRFSAKNASGGTMTRGQAVYISGLSGQTPEVSLAQANSSSTMPAFGVVQTASANANASVEVVTFGNLVEYTNSYTQGAELYVSESTAGLLTETRPKGSANLIQNLAKTLRTGSSGSLKVGGAGRTNATPNLDQGTFFIGDSNNCSSASTYTLPTTDGSVNQVLTTDGAGAVSFADAGGGPETVRATADVSAVDFDAVNYFIPYTVSADLTINLPSTKTNLTQTESLTGKQLKITNASAYNVTLRIDDGWHYVSPVYYQTYIRHPQDHDATGVGIGEPVTYVIPAYTKATIYIDEEYNTSTIRRISYNLFNLYHLSPNNWGLDTTLTGTTALSAPSGPPIYEEIYLVNASSASTITLPNPASGATVPSGFKYSIKSVGAGVVTIDTASGTIDGGSSFVLSSQYDSVTLVCDGSNYFVI